MFIGFKGNLIRTLFWQWKASLLFLIAGGLVYGAHLVLGDVVSLPIAPIAVLGGAIGIFVSFRTNAGYDRWWEGRKLWGRMINTSRHFCTQVLSYLPKNEDGTPTELQRRLVRRHVAYVHALRVLLRSQDLSKDEEFLAMLPEEDAGVHQQSNPTHALLHAQTEELTAAVDRGELNEFRLTKLDSSIAFLLDIQGGCERIKGTPFPSGYGFIASRLIWFFSFLLPVALVQASGWVAIPLSFLVCMGFMLIGEVGRVLENPFTMYFPALPLSALSRKIEINLRERLGESDLPPELQPNNGVLM